MNSNCPGDSFPPPPPLADNGSAPNQQALPILEANILVANEQATLAIDEPRLIAAVHAILAGTEFTSAYVSIAVVDDPTIHALNVQYLQHDYPTDVLSFVLEQTENRIEGELVVSADTASREAADAGWSPHDELLLYVIHGTLHLVGYDDHAPADQSEMVAAEAHYLQALGITLPTDRSRWTGTNHAGKESS
jgi:probable rRNA maturation factor